jgi:hydroxymethylpyrimidine/phosphomethylpyrimidine kinase
MPSVMCVAGLDPSGLSGLSTDIRALDSIGVRCLPVASVLTVQNSRLFSEIQEVPSGLLARQIEAIREKGRPASAKVGLLGSAEQVSWLSESLSGNDIPVVVDTVFSSSTGFGVLDEEMLDSYIHDLLPAATLVTPNAAEAGVLCGLKVADLAGAEEAARMILDMGPAAVLVKGGHLERGRGTDILVDRKGVEIVAGSPVNGDFRGTGCAYSALIAGHLALGSGVRGAVLASKRAMAEALHHSSGISAERLEFGPAGKGGGT